MNFNFETVISFLENHFLVTNIISIFTDELLTKGTYRIKCQLIPSKLKFEIRYVVTEKDLIYSYQLFDKTPLIRWDNAPHYPNIKTHPHHYHDLQGNVNISNLTGDYEKDLQIVFQKLSEFIANY
ncbi:MAG: hypothetical protein HY738_20950 [Bacteroidia bacterium]|nr:hypothetical protein [Bacteroidia bacterium]